jgi:hypothetical protein
MRKIGLHILNGTNLKLGRPAIVKLVDPSVEYVKQIRDEVGPNCTILVRFMDYEQLLDNPENRAAEWFTRHLPKMQAMTDPYVVFEGYNEIPDELARPYCTFEMNRLWLMHAKGLRAGVGNFSVGRPHESVWSIYQPMLREMHDKDILCLHEYWADQADIWNPWHVGRFALPEVAPYVNGKAIAITEAGRDFVEGRGAPGWKRTCGEGEYLADLLFADEVYCKHDQVIGFTVFQVGSRDPQFDSFDVYDLWSKVVAETEVTTPMPAPVTFKHYDGKCYTIKEYSQYVAAADCQVNKVIIHHTAKPTPDTWNGEATMLAMKRYYEQTKGWDHGPHAFIAPDGIWVMAPLGTTNRGHGWSNTTDINIEIVGNYTNSLPEGDILYNATWATALLLHKGKLNTIDHLSKHNDYAMTECPGKTLSDNFAWFKDRVNEIMPALDSKNRQELEDLLGFIAQEHIIPLNPNAALEKYAQTMGLLPASDEFELTQNSKTYVAQAFRSPGERDWQYVLYTEKGFWNLTDILLFKRRN